MVFAAVVLVAGGAGLVAFGRRRRPDEVAVEPVGPFHDPTVTEAPAEAAALVERSRRPGNT
jgi:hypothetical protein